MKKLAVIGASYLQLPIVKKAHEMGVKAYCFAWREGAVCADHADGFYPIDIKDKDKILDVCRDLAVDGVTTIASDTSVPTVNYVASRMGLISNPDQYSAITTNKYLMRRCFREAGVPSPQFALANHASDYDVDGFQYPLIVKPTDRSGSIGVEKVNDDNELRSAACRALRDSFEQQAIIEEFVEGREVSVEAISWQGRHYILQITDKVTTGAPYFVELEHHQPSSLPVDTQSRIKSIVRDALDALHVEYGASHSELKVSADGHITVIEIGARMGGDFIGSDLVRLSTGYDFLRGVIEIALGEFLEPVLSKHLCSGVYFLSEETKRLLPVIEHWRDYPEIIEAQITDPVLRRIERSGDRSGYLIYQSNKRMNIITQ